MKRALIISYYWPPTGGSGVQRWVKFAKYLPAEGWQPVIYTPSNPEALAIDKSLVDEIPPEVEVIKRKIFEPYGIYRRLLGRKSASDGGSDEVNPVNGQKKTLKQRLFMAIRGKVSEKIPEVPSRGHHHQHRTAAFHAPDSSRARARNRIAVDCRFPRPMDQTVLFQAPFHDRTGC